MLAGFFRRLGDFLKFGGVFGGFSAAGQNSAYPDIRRRLGTLAEPSVGDLRQLIDPM